jgi:hypothetical protein
MMSRIIFRRSINSQEMSTDYFSLVVMLTICEVNKNSKDFKIPDKIEIIYRGESVSYEQGSNGVDVYTDLYNFLMRLHRLKKLEAV